MIADALLRASSKSNPLSHLECFVTVATPFITNVKDFWLFSRSGLIGKSALVSLPAIALVFGGAFFRHDVKTLMHIILLVALLYVGLWIINRRLFFRYRQSVLRFATREYSSRLVSLCHRDDEAINGLKSLPSIDIKLFHANFASSFLSFSSLFLLPSVFLLIAIVPSLLTTVLPYTDDVVTQDAFGRISRLLAYFIWRPILRLLDHLFGPLGLDTTIRAGFVLLPLAFFAISLAITYLVELVGPVVSRLLSIGLNRLTWQQIRKIGFGNDSAGETSISADGFCKWLSLKWLPLPKQLDQEITELSNNAASLAVGKFRRLFAELALSKDKEAREFFYSEYLTWDELIHCSYFSVPRFQMLVAYAIANSEGFRPAEAFKNHSDYNLVADWYEQMRPKETSSRRRDRARYYPAEGPCS